MVGGKDRKGTPGVSDIFELLKKIAPAPKGTATITHILAGLGNPGDKYRLNRHNVGFLCVDYLMQKYSFKVNRLRFQALCGECEIGGRRVLVMKPQTYMNSSGDAIHEAAQFYKIPPEKVIVLYDDISLEPGRMRIRGKGSAGGHNGIKSVIAQLGTDVFPRIKLGVGSPPEGYELMNWVLGDLPKTDWDKVYACIEKTAPALELLLNGEIERAMGLYNN